MVQERLEGQELYIACWGDLEVDMECWALRWRKNGKLAGYYNKENGYIQVRVRGHLYLAHRIIYLLFNFTLPPLIDHIDRNPTNNCISNLREADKRTNAINTGTPANNTSGIKGVSWHKAGGKWTAQIKYKGRKIHLGSYALLMDAVEARLKAEEELWCDIR
tara:strand:- start:199 stop:684 length:486 start_codon:yes stop_codon:yes gene_type:complete